MARVSAVQAVNPPEKGSFPLDHLAECRSSIESYFMCMHEHNNLAPKCREQARDYLRCRMDKDLMEQEGLDKWFPKTEFIDMRHKKHEQRLNETSTLPALMRNSRLRQQPDGYEIAKQRVLPTEEELRAMNNKANI
eukprot:TRINITY_DN13649_c0_g1_i1.p1 TRINITY_DN13649_c0_g1~~TRINITY_DN13649_c0_g1_i1.p1  ORF type:complete len:136 (+),score=26.94 TRINITY_DN13649_c0_g1_i1:31-438(+)